MHIQLTLAGNLQFTTHHSQNREQFFPYFQHLIKSIEEDFNVLEISEIGECPNLLIYNIPIFLAMNNQAVELAMTHPAFPIVTEFK